MIKFFYYESEVKGHGCFWKSGWGWLYCFIEELPGVNSQGESLDEAKSNLPEALDLVMDTQLMLSEQTLVNKNVIRESLHLASWKQRILLNFLIRKIVY